MDEAIAWAEREIEHLKADEFYRPEMTAHLEALVEAAKAKTDE